MKELTLIEFEASKNFGSSPELQNHEPSWSQLCSPKKTIARLTSTPWLAWLSDGGKTTNRDSPGSLRYHSLDDKGRFEESRSCIMITDETLIQKLALEVLGMQSSQESRYCIMIMTRDEIMNSNGCPWSLEDVKFIVSKNIAHFEAEQFMHNNIIQTRNFPHFTKQSNSWACNTTRTPLATNKTDGGRQESVY